MAGTTTTDTVPAARTPEPTRRENNHARATHARADEGTTVRTLFPRKAENGGTPPRPEVSSEGEALVEALRLG